MEESYLSGTPPKSPVGGTSLGTFTLRGKDGMGALWDLCGYKESKKARTMRNQKGFSLVEAVVASAIAVTMGIVALTFISYSGKATRRVDAERQIQHAGSVIGEMIQRELRETRYVTQVDSTKPPVSTVSGLKAIKLFKDNGDTVRYYVTAGGYFVRKVGLGGARDSVFAYQCRIRSTSSFTVHESGTTVSFDIRPYKTVMGITYSYAPVLGTARCRNWYQQTVQAPADLGPLAGLVPDYTNPVVVRAMGGGGDVARTW